MQSELEIDYIDKFFQAKYWPSLAEKFLYRNGDPVPEMINAFFAMNQYNAIRENKGGGKKEQAGDI